jgi:ribosome assembly protein 1
VLEHHEITHKDLINSLITGFDIATYSGPLCEEPMLGACFIVETIEKNTESV